MSYFYDQIGMLETWSLFAATFALISAAHYVAFRQALRTGEYNWSQRPLRSILTFAARHELYYLKQVPLLIGSVLTLVSVTVAL